MASEVPGKGCRVRTVSNNLRKIASRLCSAETAILPLVTWLDTQSTQQRPTDKHSGNRLTNSTTYPFLKFPRSLPSRPSSWLSPKPIQVMSYFPVSTSGRNSSAKPEGQYCFRSALLCVNWRGSFSDCISRGLSGRGHLFFVSYPVREPNRVKNQSPGT